MSLFFCSIKMEKPVKKRQARWAECKWCKLRGEPIIFRSGKRKCLERHMVQCKTAYELEKSQTHNSELIQTVKLLQRSVADLAARVTVLELQKKKYFKNCNRFWDKMTPKCAWNRAKENTKRLIRA